MTMHTMHTMQVAQRAWYRATPVMVSAIIGTIWATITLPDLSETNVPYDVLTIATDQQAWLDAWPNAR